MRLNLGKPRHPSSQRNMHGLQHSNDQADGGASTPSRCRLEAQKFMDRAQVPGVSHCSPRHNFVWRIAWAVITLAGLAMGIIQSIDVFSDFLGHSIVQVITFEMKSELIFPAITVCSNILVDQNVAQFLFDDAIEKLARDAEVAVDKAVQQSLPYTDIEAKIDSYRTQVMKEMAGNWSHEKRVLTFGNSNVFQDCKWKSRKCDFSKEFFTFYNLRYGKCMTFNAGFADMKKAGSDQGFTGILDMNLKSRTRVINPEYAVLLIHPSSLPPVPGLQNVIRVHPGDRIRILIQGKSVNYLKVKHIKPCIPEDETNDRANDLYYSKATPFKYSESACIASCRFHKTIETYGCVDPSLPLEPVLQAFRKGTRTICNYTDFLSDMEIPVAACNCLKTCKEPVITPVETVTSLIKMSSKFLSSIANSTDESSFNKISAHHAVIQIAFANTEYMKVMEEPKYSTADFFGMFGGNLSLWVGVNFLCLVELLEFILILLYCKVLYLRKNYTNKPESTMQMST